MGLKVQFFTIVRNGMPFIRHHWDTFSQLECVWHWHVVEGGAKLNHDTAWSCVNGGKIPEDFLYSSLSTDGTTEYLDELVESGSSRITLYRKEGGELWDGKLEMIRAPLAGIQEECLLWQIDCDEFWSKDQIEAVVREFEAQPKKTAAWYWCDFFVGPDLKICTRNCYSQNPEQEWLRTWRYLPGDQWSAHEPPTLIRKRMVRKSMDVGRINPLTHRETEAMGAVFKHFAYVQESQLVFKENYYGYRGAVAGWRRLQEEFAKGVPLKASDYLSWVKDFTYVLSDSGQHGATAICNPPMVLIDGLVFQLPWARAIQTVWKNVLNEWVKSGISKHVSILDRGGTMPEIPGINKLPFDIYDESCRGQDALKLQDACNKYRADTFVSTYYSCPITTPSVALHHDFIPERRGSRMAETLWEEKKITISQASFHVCVSENTARDLQEFYPSTGKSHILGSRLGVGSHLKMATDSEVGEFREKYAITKPYILIVGERIGLVGEATHVAGYKNAEILFYAMNNWEHAQKYDLVIVGGAAVLENELSEIAPEISPIMVKLDDDELSAAYSGAEALVYPSRYEGFGLPVLEAMACGCPVITTALSSLPEVAGDAALYIDPDDVDALRDALLLIRDPKIRADMVSRGKLRAAGYSWSTLAADLWKAIQLAADEPRHEISGKLYWFRKIQSAADRRAKEFENADALTQSWRRRMKRWDWLIHLKVKNLILKDILSANMMRLSFK